MTGLWHWAVHVAGVDQGAAYGQWDWYNFWSGIAGSFLIGAVVWLASLYTRHTCHTWWCWRPGHFPFTDQDTGLTYKLCRRCHPLHPGKRLTRRRIARIHHANRAKKGTR